MRPVVWVLCRGSSEISPETFLRTADGENNRTVTEAFATAAKALSERRIRVQVYSVLRRPEVGTILPIHDSLKAPTDVVA